MAKPTSVVLALSVLVGGVLVSALLLLPSGAGIGVDGDGDQVSVTASDSPEALASGRETLIDHGDAGGDRRGRLDSRPTRRVESPILPVRSAVEPSEVGAHLDPDAFYPAWVSSGIVSDVGDFQDPDYDLPQPMGGGAAYVGEYIEPEGAP